MTAKNTAAEAIKRIILPPGVRRSAGLANIPVEYPLHGGPKRLGLCSVTVMPTVLRFDHLRVVIYAADHRRAHVHVIAADGEAVSFLNCPHGPPELQESYGFDRTEVNPIRDSLAGKVGALCKEWRNIHGGD